MKRVRLALIALVVGIAATACDTRKVTGNLPSPCGNGPTMGSGC